MGAYNTIAERLICPECGRASVTVVQFKAGLNWQLDYRVGDLYEWVPQAPPQRGGRPPFGDVDVDGCAECPCCGLELDVWVSIRSDHVMSARVNPDRSHLPAWPGWQSKSNCGEPEDVVQSSGVVPSADDGTMPNG